jgi:hypothetical protein
MCHRTYSNKSWSIVAQGMFSLREVNQMEREMCTYLDWELTVDDPILTNFQKAVKSDFGKQKSVYPNYPTMFVSKRAARAEASTKNPAQQARFRVLATTNTPLPMSNLVPREHQPIPHGEQVPIPPIPHRRVIRTRHRLPPQARLRHLLVGKKRILRFVVWIPHQALASWKASPRRIH